MKIGLVIFVDVQVVLGKAQVWLLIISSYWLLYIGSLMIVLPVAVRSQSRHDVRLLRYSEKNCFDLLTLC